MGGKFDDEPSDITGGLATGGKFEDDPSTNGWLISGTTLDDEPSDVTDGWVDGGRFMDEPSDTTGEFVDGGTFVNKPSDSGRFVDGGTFVDELSDTSDGFMDGGAFVDKPSDTGGIVDGGTFVDEPSDTTDGLVDGGAFVDEPSDTGEFVAGGGFVGCGSVVSPFVDGEAFVSGELAGSGASVFDWSFGDDMFCEPSGMDVGLSREIGGSFVGGGAVSCVVSLFEPAISSVRPDAPFWPDAPPLPPPTGPPVGPPTGPPVGPPEGPPPRVLSPFDDSFDGPFPLGVGWGFAGLPCGPPGSSGDGTSKIALPNASPPTLPAPEAAPDVAAYGFISNSPSVAYLYRASVSVSCRDSMPMSMMLSGNFLVQFLPNLLMKVFSRNLVIPPDNSLPRPPRTGASAAPMAPTAAAFLVWSLFHELRVPIPYWVSCAATSINSWNAILNTAAWISWIRSLPSRLLSKNRTMAILAASHAIDPPPVNGDIAIAHAISAARAISE